MSKPLEGRIALITGANRGIGLAIAKAYGRAGAHCILAARNKAALEEVAAVLQRLASNLRRMITHGRHRCSTHRQLCD